MGFVGNEKTMLVHATDCEFAEKITLGRIDFEELYHALAGGYQEAGCCLTDEAYAEYERGNAMKSQSRASHAKGGCLICGERRATQLAHVIPRASGGARRMPLCPNHHKMYDEGLLTRQEIKSLQMNHSSPDLIKQMHGAVKRNRAN